MREMFLFSFFLQRSYNVIFTISMTTHFYIEHPYRVGRCHIIERSLRTKIERNILYFQKNDCIENEISRNDQ